MFLLIEVRYRVFFNWCPLNVLRVGSVRIVNLTK